MVAVGGVYFFPGKSGSKRQKAAIHQLRVIGFDDDHGFGKGKTRSRCAALEYEDVTKYDDGEEPWEDGFIPLKQYSGWQVAVARLLVVERGGSAGYKVAGGRRSSSRSSRSRSRWGSRSRSRKSSRRSRRRKVGSGAGQRGGVVCCCAWRWRCGVASSIASRMPALVSS